MTTNHGKDTGDIDAARAKLRELRARFYEAYRTREALQDRKCEENPAVLIRPDADEEVDRAITHQNVLLAELYALARRFLEQFNAKPGSEVFHYLIEHDSMLESMLGASPLQMAIKKGTLRRPVMVTTQDGRKLEWIGLFLASGQWVGLENGDAEELLSPQEREIEKEGCHVVPDLDVQLVKDGQLVDGTMTSDGLFFPIDGPLAFLDAHRAVADPD
ncbi:hypothetical protein [Burkholderia sp. WTPI3]|uniref:hypothetical protein n=1 Tax=Burkholderia sp. WTPI3 TaxID=2822167 RepID=UPI001F214899|nr:hypothetical protein [Burkholderia sp. WTPI3]